MTLDDGSNVKGTFTGNIPNYGNRNFSATLTAAKYNTNPQDKGTFYVTLNDANYRIEMAVVFNAAEDATVLPEGEYTYSANGGAGTFTQASYLTIYRPSNDYKMQEGSKVKVTKSGDTYTLTMDLNIDIAGKENASRKATVTYTGEISGTPAFKDDKPVTEYTFTSISDKGYTGSVELTMATASGDASFYLTLYGADGSTYMSPGTYEVKAGETPFTVDTDQWYSNVTIAGVQHTLTAGNVTVEENGRGYTIVANLTLDDGSSVKGTYTGELPSYGKYITKTLNVANYNENPQNKGTFYITGNDEKWDVELAIVFKAAEDATVLPEGSYTYSADATAAGTFGGSESYVTTYGPYVRNNITEGSTINVTKSGDAYTLNMDLKLDNGRIATLTYTGEISGTPSFKEPSFDFTKISATPKKGSYGTIVLTDEAQNAELSLDFYVTKGSSYLNPGTYTVNDTWNPMTVDTDYSTAKINGANHNLKSGTVTVEEDGTGNIITVDIILDDDSKVKGTYSGRVPNYGKYLEKTLNNAAYNTNAQPKGTFYVKLNDTAYDFDMAIVFNASEDATLLPEGEYMYSADGGVNTFTSRSYLTDSKANVESRFLEGSRIVVEKSGDEYTITLNLLLDNGRITTFDYTGAITGTPTFE